MSESEPGRVPAEGDSGTVPVCDGALVVAEQGRREKVDQERDVARRSGCDADRIEAVLSGQPIPCSCTDETRVATTGLTLHGKHVVRVVLVVEIVRRHPLFLPHFGALPPRLHPAHVPLRVDDPMSMVALIKRDDEQIFGAFCRRRRSRCADGRDVSAVVPRGFDQLCCELCDVGDLGIFAPAVEEEQDCESGRGRSGDRESREAVHGERDPADGEPVRSRERRSPSPA